MQENWAAIHYVSGNKDTQKLLATLHERGQVGFDLISQFAGKSFSVIKKLDSFNLIETDKSRTYGYTEEGRIRESFYQLSSLGSAWFPALMSLATMTENIIAVQINLGEFPRLTKELEIFISSSNPEEVRASFEFIFGNDFHERTKHKLNNHLNLLCKIHGVLNANTSAAINILKRKDDKEISLYTPYLQVKEILEARI